MFVLHFFRLLKFLFNPARPLTSISPRFLHHLDVLSCLLSPPSLPLCSMFRGVRAAKVLHEVDFSTLTCVCVCEKEITRESFPLYRRDFCLLSSSAQDLSSFISQDSLQQTKATDSSRQPAHPPSLSFFFFFFSSNTLSDIPAVLLSAVKEQEEE